MKKVYQLILSSKTGKHTIQFDFDKDKLQELADTLNTFSYHHTEEYYVEEVTGAYAFECTDYHTSSSYY